MLCARVNERRGTDNGEGVAYDQLIRAMVVTLPLNMTLCSNIWRKPLARGMSMTVR